MTNLQRMINEYASADCFDETIKLAYLLYSTNPSLDVFDSMMRAFAATVIESCITDGASAVETDDLVKQLFKDIK